MTEQGEPKISIFYDGAYSSKLNWRTDRLSEFANQGDLRTYVYIVTGDEIDHPQVNILGDTLAWSSILLAANPFIKPSGLGKPSNVIHSYSEDKMDATIVINHQILLERTKIQNDGGVDAQTYATLLDNEVRSGLRRIIFAEKFDLFKYTGGVLGLDVAFVALSGPAAYIQAELIQLVNPGSIGGPIELAYNFMYWASRVGEVTLPLATVLGGFNRYREFNEAIKEDPSQYISSLKDMNPFKYPADAIRGWFYLRGEGNQLVEVEE